MRVIGRQEQRAAHFWMHLIANSSLDWRVWRHNPRDELLCCGGNLLGRRRGVLCALAGARQSARSNAAPDGLLKGHLRSESRSHAANESIPSTNCVLDLHPQRLPHSGGAVLVEYHSSVLAQREAHRHRRRNVQAAAGLDRSGGCRIRRAAERSDDAAGLRAVLHAQLLHDDAHEAQHLLHLDFVHRQHVEVAVHLPRHARGRRVVEKHEGTRRVRCGGYGPVLLGRHLRLQQHRPRAGRILPRFRERRACSLEV
mmetsp:Transcript_12686/g.53364  ORF Transcript_12686/g.53364 Transcript_12686/m.53364 type:complete len:255 (-) Transcript_12686:392-1156(-)